MTILGVKNLFNSNRNKLDVDNILSLKADYYKNSLKKRSRVLLEKINKLKYYGKKNSS